MVVLTREMALKGISNKSRVFGPKTDEWSFEERVRRNVTHLHLQSKSIDSIDGLNSFLNLTVLYLYENNLEKISGLDKLANLEILHLEKNGIKRIEGLTKCSSLSKLYLGDNRIEVVEGLEKNLDLKELHLEGQKLSLGAQLVFDPRTMQALSKCLRMLDISRNSVESLEDVKNMVELRVLCAENNRIFDLKLASNHVGTMPHLQSLELKGNPITRVAKYREMIISNAGNIELLDGKDVPYLSRSFITKFEKQRQVIRHHPPKPSDEFFIPCNYPEDFQSEYARQSYPHQSTFASNTAPYFFKKY